MRCRVLLIDDHEVFRDAVSHVLAHEPDLEVVGSCNSVERGLTLLDAISPELVLLDFNLQGRRGTDFVRAAQERGFTGKVLMVSAGLPDSELQWCFTNGVSGVFLKDQPLATLLRAIRAVLEGRIWYDQQQMQVSLGFREKPNGPTFTDRERAILRGVVAGLSNKEIADQLQVPETAVKGGVQRLFEKIGTRSRGSLVRIAIEKYRDLVS
jgi:two-component system nitrate/nitrite response regulator NarL